MTSRRHARRRLLVAAYALAACGIAALVYCVMVWRDARVYQETANREFERELQSAEQAHVAPAPAAPASKLKRGAAARPAEVARPSVADAHKEDILKKEGVVGRLEIPRLHLSVMVVEGDTDGDLRHAAGHIPGTALPGQPGNIAIAGHRDTFFRPLRSIRPDDTIVLRTVDGAYRYRVTEAMVVGPRDVTVLRPEAHGPGELTLVTCFPFNYVGSAPKRFIVRAERSGV